MTRYLGHELVGDGLMVLEANLSGGERTLQEEAQRQLGQLSLNQGADGLMGEGEDLLALLLPLIVLQVEGQKETRRLSQRTDESHEWVQATREGEGGTTCNERSLKKENKFLMVL